MLLRNVLLASVVVALLWHRRWLCQTSFPSCVTKFGFILYAIAGGDVPPWSTHSSTHFNDWAKPGDVILSGGGKTGTTWMMNILHQIRTGGDETFEDIFDVVPWMDMLMYPGQTWKDLLERWNRQPGFSTNHQDYHYRAFETHDFPPLLPVKDDIKYVVLYRNATDVMASIKPFFGTFSDEFRSMWVGFPPEFSSDEAFDDWFLKDAGNSNSGAQAFHIDSVKAWWPYRTNTSNVLFVHYSDLRLNFDSALARLCHFFGVHLSSEQIDRVKQFTSIDWMKKNMHKFETLNHLKAAKELGILSEDATAFAKRGMV